MQFKTIAYSDQSKIDGEAFKGLHRLFKKLYPLLHDTLSLELINKYSLLYTWQGKNPELDPIMLTSHLDVVPALETEDSRWRHDPFSGDIADGYIWGRGSLDVKNGVVGIMEAVTNLLKSGYQPERTIYLAFGHDEEISGINGAKVIAAKLEERGVHLACLLDEGGSIMQGFLDGIDAPVGMVGISEKGFISLKLSVKTKGGHSSMPPATTAIGRLALSVAALEANPFPAHLDIVQFLMSYLGKELSFTQRMAFANTWLFGGMLKRKLAQANTTNAMMRTTTAPTIFNAGDTDNVLPVDAEAVVNFRILPGDTLRDVYEKVVAVIDDEQVEVKPLKAETLESDYGWDPTPVADTEAEPFITLKNLIEAAFPGVLAAPYLVLGGTDARHYRNICQNAFRFSPVFLNKEELKSVHGVNERLSIENCGRMVAFYMAYIEKMDRLETAKVSDPRDEEETAPMRL
ncbi:MAG: M20 family peptidase [Anaerolineaceae bacterium]|nr:M20 family peptidase [Anaerolineaceae bacterium]